MKEITIISNYIFQNTEDIEFRIIGSDECSYGEIFINDKLEWMNIYSFDEFSGKIYYSKQEVSEDIERMKEFLRNNGYITITTKKFIVPVGETSREEAFIKI